MTEDNEASRNLLDEARAAWDYQTSGMGWLKWVAVGKGVQECQRQALVRAKANDMKSNAARKAMSSILEAERLDRIDKGDRSVLLTMMADLPAITAWRDTLTVTERMRYNHPRAVMTRYKKATTVPPPTLDDGVAAAPVPRGYKAAYQVAEAAYQDAKARVTALEQRIKTGGSLFNVRNDKDADDIARSLVDSVDAERAERIGQGILHMLRDPPKPKGKAIRSGKATRAAHAPEK